MKLKNKLLWKLKISITTDNLDYFEPIRKVWKTKNCREGAENTPNMNRTFREFYTMSLYDGSWDTFKTSVCLSMHFPWGVTSRGNWLDFYGRVLIGEQSSSSTYNLENFFPFFERRTFLSGVQVYTLFKYEYEYVSFFVRTLIGHVNPSNRRM